MNQLDVTVPRRRVRCGVSMPRTPTKGDVALVQLGRYGDIINALPIALHIHNSYRKPYMVVSKEFADVLDGVSYVHPCILDLPCMEINQALLYAKVTFTHVIQTQIYGDSYVQDRQTPAYNLESWRMAGMLPKFYDKRLMPVFDRATSQYKIKTKPLIVTNLTSGHSSPFSLGAGILESIKRSWSETHEVVDLGGVKMPRIYDLLGLLHSADIIVSCDTSLLHLAPISGAALVAIVNPSTWSGTMPRMDAQVLNYRHINSDMVNRAIAQAFKPRRFDHILPAPNQIKRAIYHVVPVYSDTPKEDQFRKKVASNSWSRMYSESGVIPVHVTSTKRSMSHYGSDGKLPFIRDVLGEAIKLAKDDDIIVYTNDDIICHPDLPNQLQFYCSVYDCVGERRCELSPTMPPPSLNDLPSRWVDISRAANIPHGGRDLFAFTKRWIVRALDEMPDFVIGATDWDNCLIGMMRRHFGYDLDIHALQNLVWPCEMPSGWTAHIYHKSYWKSFGNFHHSPANNHNRILFREWASKHAPSLKFDDSNLLLPP